MSKYFRLAFVSMMVLLISSCGNMGQGNFNKRKYTNLKSKPTYKETTYTEIESSDAKLENEFPSSKEEIADNHRDQDNILAEEELSIEIVEDEIEEIEVVELRQRIETSLGPELKDRRDFNQLNKVDQERALRQFNKIFNSGLAIMVLCGLLAVAVLVFAVVSLDLLWIVLACIGGLLLFTDWVMSMVALNRVRKIDVASRTKRFRIKFRLAQVVAYLGVAVCVVTMIGGLVLLILWGARVISF